MQVDLALEHLTQFDKEHIWHPYTSLVDPLPSYTVKSAQGVELELQDGRKLIDGMSSWWACIHGYNHPVLNKALIHQINTISHVMFGGINHEPAYLLAKKLLDLLPNAFHNVFFCDSGSVAVEVAMKMALQYHHAKSRKTRTKFLTSRFGYHGDTTGAMSVCDPISGMHHLFADFLPQHIFGPAFPMGLQTSVDQKILREYEVIIEENKDSLAAFIIEPVVQGAGGMRIYNPRYLNSIKQLCEKHDILFIADEIATGFGRTGKLFASNYGNFTPDIICLGKALSAGYLSFAATVSSKEVGHCISSKPPYVFMHGPTFMANPSACAVSLASLQLLEEDIELKAVKQIETQLTEALKEIDNAKDIRCLGAIAVVEFEKNINIAKAQEHFVRMGLWIRPFRNLIYIMPPYIINSEQLMKLIQGIKEIAKIKEVFLEE